MITSALDISLNQFQKEAVIKNPQGQLYTLAASYPSGTSGTSGTVFKIQRIALHDGPGIRTVIFFKGCPLRCLWCSSPESQHSGIEVLYDPHRCMHSLDCLDACPEQALSLINKNRIAVDHNRCIACGRCVTACTHEARSLTGRTVHVSDIIQEIHRDEIFYHRSSGGVTLSGGEPLLQPDFALAILKATRYRGIHTAMETCGYAKWDILSKLCSCLDLIYIDLKQIDPDAHQKLTGVSNELILDNIRQVDASCLYTSLIVRIPVIPGYNNTKEEMERIAGFVSTLNRVERVELLPYHRYGIKTYEQLGREYDLHGQGSPSGQQMHALAGLFADKGIAVEIGG